MLLSKRKNMKKSFSKKKRRNVKRGGGFQSGSVMSLIILFILFSVVTDGSVEQFNITQDILYYLERVGDSSILQYIIYGLSKFLSESQFKSIVNVLIMTTQNLKLKPILNTFLVTLDYAKISVTPCTWSEVVLKSSIDYIIGGNDRCVERAQNQANLLIALRNGNTVGKYGTLVWMLKKVYSLIRTRLATEPLVEDDENNRKSKRQKVDPNDLPSIGATAEEEPNIQPFVNEIQNVIDKSINNPLAVSPTNTQNSSPNNSVYNSPDNSLDNTPDNSQNNNENLNSLDNRQISIDTDTGYESANSECSVDPKIINVIVDELGDNFSKLILNEPSSNAEDLQNILNEIGDNIEKNINPLDNCENKGGKSTFRKTKKQKNKKKQKKSRKTRKTRKNKKTRNKF